MSTCYLIVCIKPEVKRKVTHWIISYNTPVSNAMPRKNLSIETMTSTLIGRLDLRTKKRGGKSIRNLVYFYHPKDSNTVRGSPLGATATDQSQATKPQQTHGRRLWKDCNGSGQTPAGAIDIRADHKFIKTTTTIGIGQP